jgi:hypothetical protein
MNRELLASLLPATAGDQELPNGYHVPRELVANVQPRIENLASLGLIRTRNLIAEIQRALRGYRPAIHRRNWDCDCNKDSYVRGIGYCGQPVVGAETGRIL